MLPIQCAEYIDIIQCTDTLILPTDDSGRWGQGGLFSALSRRSNRPETQYELASRMKGIVVVCTMAISK